MILLFNISFLSELNCSNLASIFMCYENGKLVGLTIGQFSISKTYNLNLVISSIRILSQYNLLFLKIGIFHTKVLCVLNFGHISRTFLKLSKQSYLKYLLGIKTTIKPILFLIISKRYIGMKKTKIYICLTCRIIIYIFFLRFLTKV